MLKIRLSRLGKKQEPHYRIVVSPTRSKRDGQEIVRLGHWHPKQNHLVLDRKTYDEWVKKGAQPTSAVHNLYNAKSS